MRPAGRRFPIRWDRPNAYAFLRPPAHMALIDYLGPDEADDEAGAVLQAFADEHGQAPLIYQALVHNAHVVGARYEYFGSLMNGGLLDRQLKEFTYVVVSEANTCEYCIGAHASQYTEVLGGDPAELDRVAEGEFDRLDRAKRAVAAFADQATRDPKRVSAAHLDDLRDAGFSTGEVVELLAVVASAKAANTIVDALDVHPVDRELRTAGD